MHYTLTYYVWHIFIQKDTRTDGQADRQREAGQSDPYLPLCFAGDTKTMASVPCPANYADLLEPCLTFLCVHVRDNILVFL